MNRLKPVLFNICLTFSLLKEQFAYSSLQSHYILVQSSTSKFIMKKITLFASVLMTALGVKAQITLQQIGTYKTGAYNLGAAEITAYDHTTKKLFVVNGAAAQIDVLDLTNPANPVAIDTFNITSFGAGVNSVAFKKGILAAAVEANPKQNPGKVVLFNANGDTLRTFTVGALPDMVTFTPDGNKILVANEGEPSDDFSNDPEGSVSVIDITNGLSSATVTTIGFTDFNVGGSRHNEIANAIGRTMKIAGIPGTTVAQSLEPEYITVSENNQTAYVVCQEANAMAVINLTDNTITALLPLGYKDHSLPQNALDASNQNNGNINITTFPVRGLYQPDAIASYTVNGQTYIVSANEGDDMDYAAFSEKARIGNNDVVLDTVAFPNAATLKNNNNLGRLNITTAMGDKDGDGDFDTLYCYGARSFSIWNGTTGALVWDSGKDFEEITAALYPDNFNANNTNNNKKDRSDDRGPEPETVVVHQIDGKWYAFVGLERIGGIMVYDVTNPNAPTYVTYINNRNFSVTPNAANVNTVGDLGPEGITMIDAAVSPNGKNLLVVSNEVSGTVTLFEVKQTIPTYSIAQVRGNNTDGKPDSVGVKCRLRGTVYGINLRSTTQGGLEFFINDGTAGIGVFQANKNFGYTVTEGDSIEVVGTIGHFRGRGQISTLDTIIKLASNRPLKTPTNVTISQLGENTEADLIIINNVTLVAGTWPATPTGSGFTARFANGTDTVSVRIDNQSDLFAPNTAPSGAVNIVGIGDQFSGSNCTTCTTGYQILPRRITDIMPVTSIAAAQYFMQNVTVYPNPVQDKLFVNAQWKNEQFIRLQVIDMQGRVVFQQKKFTQQLEENIATKQWAKGMYLLQISNGTQRFTRKVVVE